METRIVYQDSVTPLPVQLGITPSGLMVHAANESHLHESMPVLFSIKLAKERQTELEQRVGKGEVISPDELYEKYSSASGELTALKDWLKAEGFAIKKIAKDGSGIYTDATVDQIQKSLQVKMVRVTKDGFSYTAAQNAPSLPSTVGRNVHAIIGLQPFRQARKNFRMRTPKHHNRTRALAPAVASTGLNPAIQNAPPYLASEILKAYNADGLGLTGKNQTIAILIDTFPLDSDLLAFWQNNNLNTDLTRIEKINVTGQELPPQEGEETLDVQWTTGIAPDANIRIYASGTLQFVDLDQALDQIIEDVSQFPGMCQLSISLGLGETYMGGLEGEVTTQHLKFLKLAALGVNIFASSGDAGSNPDASGHSATGPLQVEHPASDPFVIGVGGTSLQLSNIGVVTEEDAWVSSGGGQSIYYDRPVWQTGAGIPEGGRRLVPDVGLTADPDFGAYVILNGAVRQFGGTSWSAPVWAGFCAMLNESRQNAGKPSLSFLNPLLYPLINTSCFRNISKGTNGAYQATDGYDMITGIGVPDIGELSNELNK
ncbi:protease pro-enzyme activation domain-containing protein [Mucilaginibacter angelicae]|uniref:Protease pro-enzyme activation domain-containing protein n=1 Tax=Mucilaginibacter angelicae TaxID=869718 RepID=A0ABV6L0W8_9SPHI